MNAARNPAGIVIVGSGLAGYSLTREFRKRDATTPLTLVTADGGEVYSKPMLSNAFGQSKAPDALVSKSAADAASELDMTILTRHSVLAIDRAAKRIELLAPDGTRHWLAYERLVLALGADPRPYVVPGSEDVPVASVNDIDGYRRWHASLAPGASVLLIGAGLIGSEFANDLAGGGYRVTMVDPMGWPLGRLVPEGVGHALATALRGAGITLHLGRSVARLVPAPSGAVAVLDDGSEIAFDKALSAIGLVPRTALAKAAGLTVAQGIVVDELLTTSDPDIFALGDCAQTGAGVLPFVLPLIAKARALAATLSGTPTILRLPALPVGVKTPALPIIICPPAPGTEGSWQLEGEGGDLRAMFVTPDGISVGFALAGLHIKERQALAKTMPDILA